MEHRLEGLIERCRTLKPMLTGVVHPCSADALAGAVEAAEAGLIVPIFYGPEAEIRRIADQAHLDIAKYRIVATDDPEDSALKAAIAAGAGEVAALMKGSLHTDVLLHAVMQKEAKLRTGRLISHCAMMSAPTYARRFVLSDVALNIAPDTDQKRDICQNAIGFARALGIDATESGRAGGGRDGAHEDASHARRRDPGQDGGPRPDRRRHRRWAAGPRRRGRPRSGEDQAHRLAGRGPRRCLIVPNIEAGNMVYKNLAFMADAQTAGLVVGARVPVILTSRADTAAARRFSAAAAVLYADALARDPVDPSP